MGKFEEKFLCGTGDDQNKQNCFDACYGLPNGERAKCILDWERRQVAKYAAKNKLDVICLMNYAFSDGPQNNMVEQTAWYPLPEGFMKKTHGGLRPYYVCAQA